MKLLAVALLLALLAAAIAVPAAFAASTSGYGSYGSSVTVTLDSAIGSSSDDVVTVSGRYALSEDGYVAGLASKRAYGSSSASGTGNLLSLRQPYDRNYFLLFFTNSTNATVYSALQEQPEVPRKTLGTFAENPIELMKIFARLQYSAIDLVESARWVAGIRQLKVSNVGSGAGGVPMVKVEMIS